MKVKTLNIALPKALAEKLDIQASLQFASRSEYIRRAIIAQLKEENAFLEDVNENTATINDLRRQQLRLFMTKEFKRKSTFDQDTD